MGEIIGIVLLILATGLSIMASILTINALFPQRVAKTRQALEAMPGRSFGLGLINTLFLSALTLIFAALINNVHGIFMIPALFFTLLLILGLSLGLTGMADHVGGRIFESLSVIRRRSYATWILYLACLLPIIGWFVFFIYIACTSLGAAIISFFIKNPDTPAAEDE